MNCRHCGAEATLQLVDLGSAPPSNAYLTRDALRAPEAWYPLRVLVCERCWLAQTEDFVDAGELFSADYAYFSAYSASWLAHAEQYVADMVAPVRTGRRQSRRRGRGQRRVPAPVRGGARHPVHRHRADRPAPRLRPGKRGIPMVEAFFGSALAEQLAAEGRQRGPDDRQQRPGPRARHQRLRAWHSPSCSSLTVWRRSSSTT